MSRQRSSIDWSTVFDEAYPQPGVTAEEIAVFIDSVLQPLSQEEIDTINRSQRNPFPKNDPLHGRYKPFDPTLWIIPHRPLPPAYLAFLQWSNGGEFRRGERWFQFFPVHDVRATLIGYHVPQYMPGVLPFAFNGGGVFYLFDMRKRAAKGEYSILCAHAGNLRFRADASVEMASSFLEACSGSVNVEELG